MTEPEHQDAKSSSTDADSSDSGSAENLNQLESSYQSKMDEVAELITRVRHEINNPLTGVLGQAQLLLREDLSETARKRAETIEQLAIRIRDIVAQLRQVQKT